MGVSFFFLTQIWHLTKKRKKKQNEEKKYEINGPGQANKKKLCWRNESREKKNFSPHSQVAFFFSLWPMTTSDQWQQVFLFETSSICLPEWLCWKTKETIHWPNASEVVGEFNQKRNNIAALNWKKKHLSISFLRQGCFFCSARAVLDHGCLKHITGTQ